MGKALSRKGRKRVVMVQREANGQALRSSRRSQERVMELALSRRAKLVGPKNARDQKAGYALGRLELTGQISAAQHDAGEAMARIMHRYTACTGINIAGPQCPAQMVAGWSCDPEMSQAELETRKEEYRGALNAILDMRFSGINCGPIVSAVFKVCGRDEDPVPPELGYLREGLNALGRFFSRNRGNNA